MSFATCSTRFESRPARTSDVGLHVDSARTTTSSPDATRSTGSPAASYHPHATVLGVGISVYVRPGDGAGHAVIAAWGVAADAAGVAEIDDGVWQLASTPSDRTDARLARFIIALTPSVAVHLRTIQLVSQRSDADSQQIRGARSIAVRDLERTLDELCLRVVHVERRDHDRAVWNRRRRVGCPVAVRVNQPVENSRRRRAAPRT